MRKAEDAPSAFTQIPQSHNQFQIQF
jgi:hypothetical protein